MKKRTGYKRLFITGLLSIACLVGGSIGGHSTADAAGLLGGLFDRFFGVEASKPSAPLLPAGIRKIDRFVLGKGKVVGTMEGVQGAVWVIHGEENTAYRGQSGKPIFNGDLIITEVRSRMRGVMRDKSSFALTPYSKLKVDKVSYDAVENKRDSFFNLLMGQARFTVTKIQKIRGKYNADYRIKTPSALCGVQGSDFVISVVQDGDWAVSQTRFPVMQKVLAFFSPVTTAHAADEGGWVTGLVTFGLTWVKFKPDDGPEVTLSPNSFSWARQGGKASKQVTVKRSRLNQLKKQVDPAGKAAMPVFFE